MIDKALFYISLIISLIYLTPCTAQVDSVYQTALEYYNQENYQEAYRSFQNIYSQDSTQLSSLEKLGLCAYRLGDLSNARKHFTSLENKDSTNLTAIKSLAKIYETEKNTPKAIKYFSSLVIHQPDNPIHHRKLAQQYKSAKLKTDAKNHFIKAHDLNPRDLFTIYGLAELYLVEKKLSSADSILHVGVINDSLNVNLNLLLANSKYRQKDYDSTAYFMKRIRGKVDFKPHQSKMLGYAYLQIDSLDLAIRYLTQAINDDGTKEHAHYNLAIAYEKQGNIEYALHHYNLSLKAGISNNVDLCHRNLARLYSKENKLKEAIEHYQDAYKYGEDPLVLFYLARASDIYYKDKQIAIRYYNKFIRSNYDHPENMRYAKERKIYLKELEHQKK